MLRSIRQRLLGAFTTHPRRKAPRRALRRLGFENLETRELLSVTGISDGSFEVPKLATATYQYAPSGSPWQFSGGGGICSNGSPFGNPHAPDGTQAAFLQSTGSMSESVNLGAGTYSLTFMAAQRAGATQANAQELQVLVDGSSIGTITPTATTYGSYQTPNFTVTAGTHIVEFIGLDPQGGDNTAFVDEVAVSQPSLSNLISDSSFETPSLLPNSLLYAPTGSAWQFTGGAGICSEGSAFGNPNAPDGSQAAFIQSIGSMSESIFLNAGTYNLSFMAAQRSATVQAHYQEFQVLVGGTQVGLITPTGTTYGTYQTANFTLAAGTYTIQIAGLDPLGGDNTAFIDEVAIWATADSISDGNFAAPALAANTYLCAPNGSPWQFSGGGGVCSNGSAFGNPNAPDGGSQAAFLQATSSMSESVYLDGGTYSLSCMAAQRAGQKQYQEFEVLVGGVPVGMVTPSGTTYQTYQTANFTEAAGTYTVEFLGLDPQGGDNTAFVDQVTISDPELVTDGSFETPSLAAKAYQYAPNGSPWQFVGEAGVCGNGSAFGNPNAPDGSQAAFLQSAGSMSESVYLDTGTYSLTFMAAERAGQKEYQAIEVLVGGAELGVVTPTGTAYGSYETANFTEAAGTYTIRFIGLDPQGGDNTAFVDEAAISEPELIGDSSFETPALAAKTYQYAPSGSPWQFTPGGGICSNGSAFGNPNAPDGNEAAFLQSTGGMSESVYLDAGTYSLSFMAAQRSGQKEYQEFKVLVGGVQVGIVTPTSTAYAWYQTANFTEAAGTYTVALVGLNPQGGDNTAFIDEVAVSLTADTITDSSFETPGLAAKTFQNAPNGTPWQFTAGGGICSNGSVFGNPNAPDGSQAAFLQSTGGMSESVYLDAGTYSLSFMAAQRAGQKEYQEFEVLVGGVQVGLVTPIGTAYTGYQTGNFTEAAAGTYTVRFIGLDPQGGDNTAFIDALAISSTADTITDGSFATPALAAAASQYAPNGSPWQFTAGAGICSNGSSFGNPGAPDGSQAAFLQGAGTMSESVYLDAGTYNISFMAAQRAGQNQSQEFEVLVGGTQVGMVTPATTAYGSYQTTNFMEAAGTYTIQFIGLDPQGGDTTAFVDQVAIAATADAISDGNFQTPALAANAYQYAPNGSPWQFVGGAGVCGNGSGFSNPNAPTGSQAAFIQNTGSMSQALYLDAGTYSLSFLAAQRAGQSQYQQLGILVGGTQVGTITPPSTSYTLCQTPGFTVAAGMCTIEIVGLDPLAGGDTAFVDEVQIS